MGARGPGSPQFNSPPLHSSAVACLRNWSWATKQAGHHPGCPLHAHFSSRYFFFFFPSASSLRKDALLCVWSCQPQRGPALFVFQHQRAQAAHLCTGGMSMRCVKGTQTHGQTRGRTHMAGRSPEFKLPMCNIGTSK